MKALSAILWHIGFGIEVVLSICLAWPLNAYAWGDRLQPDKGNLKGKMHTTGLWGSFLLSIGISIPLSAWLTDGSMNWQASAGWLLVLIAYMLTTERYLRLLGKVDDQFSHKELSVSEHLLRFRRLHSPLRRKDTPQAMRARSVH